MEKFFEAWLKQTERITPTRNDGSKRNPFFISAKVHFGMRSYGIYSWVQLQYQRFETLHLIELRSCGLTTSLGLTRFKDHTIKVAKNFELVYQSPLVYKIFSNLAAKVSLVLAIYKDKIIYFWDMLYKTILCCDKKILI